MKGLNQENKGLLEGYGQWLEAHGYSAGEVYNIPRLSGHFMLWQQKAGRKLGDWQGQDFKAYLGYSAERDNARRGGQISGAHLNKIAHSLERLQVYLMEQGLRETLTKLPRWSSKSGPLPIYSLEQINALYAACSEDVLGWRDRAMLSLCYGCGLRSKEACSLELADWWRGRGLLQIRKSKTGKSRLIPLARGVEADLEGYLLEARPELVKAHSPPRLLLSSRGNGLGYSTLYLSFQRLLSSAGLPLRGLHSLRHSLASHLTASGMASAQVGQLLGHKSLDSTQIYVQLNSNQDGHHTLL